MSDVSVVVVTYDALPWLEQALESVRGHEGVIDVRRAAGRVFISERNKHM